MSIFDRDFSAIVPSAFMHGSLTQAVNVLEAALKEIEVLTEEKAALERLAARSLPTCRSCGEEGHTWRRCPANM